MSTDRLFDLLPALYRVRDAEQGGPLRALLAVADGELDRLEEAVRQLYDNAFIETCDEWAVPYIGDLLGVRGLVPVSDGAFSRRAFVANTLAYRRAKGTAAVLEQLARDATGWPARAVEFFDLLSTTQYVMNHVRPGKGGTVSLRGAEKRELTNGPFDRSAHTADVRRIASGRGRYNLPNVGLFVWRLQSYAVARSDARPVTAAPDGRYRFSPLGRDCPLFNRPRTETEVAHVTGESNVPGRLRRRPLYAELEARRQARADGRDPRAVYFADPPVLRVWLDDRAVPADEVAVCDLSDPPTPATTWKRPPVLRTYKLSDGSGSQSFPITVAVDPVLGRLAVTGATPARVEVAYAYGYLGDLGGGPYDRTPNPEFQPATWQAGVRRNPPAADARLVPDLLTAVRRWNTQPPGTTGVIVLTEGTISSQSLSGADAIQIPAGSRLLIVAGGWPLAPAPHTPHLVGPVEVKGTAAATDLNPGAFFLEGVRLEGNLVVAAGNLGRLALAHATIVPGVGGLTVQAGAAGLQNERLVVTLDRVIVGKVSVADTASRVELRDSIADGSPVAVVGPAARFEACTILGEVRVRTLEASNSLFTGAVVAARRQVGCARFSYLPPGSVAPRRFRCQPEPGPDPVPARPRFTSTRYGDPGYCQLSATTPAGVRRGADDEGELGAFHVLGQPQREAQLRAALDEYLRFGLEAGIVFVT